MAVGACQESSAPPFGQRRRDPLMALGKHFMFGYIFDHVIVNDPFLLLKAVHQAFLADPVDHTGDTRCYLENFIQCFIAEDIPVASSV